MSFYKQAIYKRAEQIEKTAVSRKEMKYSRRDLKRAKTNEGYNMVEAFNAARTLNDEDFDRWSKLDNERRNYGETVEQRYRKYRPQSDIKKEKVRAGIMTAVPATLMGIAGTKSFKRANIKSNKIKGAIAHVGAPAFAFGGLGYSVSKGLSNTKDRKARNRALVDRYKTDKEFRKRNSDRYEEIFKKRKLGF